MAPFSTNPRQNAFGSSLKKVVSMSRPLRTCSPFLFCKSLGSAIAHIHVQSEARQVAGAIRFATDGCPTTQFRLLHPRAFSQAQCYVAELFVESASCSHRNLRFPFRIVRPLVALVSIMHKVHRMVAFAFTIFAFLSSTSAFVSNTPLQLISTTDGNRNITIANDNNNSSSLPLSPPANYSIANVSTPSSVLAPGTTYVCSEAFGSDLNYTSCERAVSVIGLDKKVRSFAERDAGIRADILLPQRFSSSDGECVIELVIESGATIARASAENIALASFVIVRNCVAKQPSKGGIAKNIGA